MLKKPIITGLVCLSCITRILSQTVTVSDKSDLNPISNISITNQGHTRSAITSANGTADISLFGAGDTLTFSHIAYMPVTYTLQQLKAVGYKVFLSDRTIRLDEFVLSANKTSDQINSLPHKMEVVSTRQIMLQNPQTTADLLQQTGMITVQQSQMGGGSPVLRGFEANRVLIVVDGVRLNNAIYRSGHLQNVITIDPFSLEKAEVVFGPGSVIYGSDAIGGVMHFYTLKPSFSVNGKPLIKLNAFTRYASASEEISGGVNFSLGSARWASFTSIAWKSMEDLREGKNRNPFYGDWGKCFYSTERINGTDSMVANPNPEIQKNTGYMQYDLMQKLRFKPDSKREFILNLQYSNSGDIPRYDRLTQLDAATGKFKYAEWYYGPQTRFLASLNAESDHTSKLADHSSWIIAYQNISEDRIQRKFGNAKKEYRMETVDVISLNADLTKKIGTKSRLNYGAEILLDQVGSEAYAQNIETGDVAYNISTRYPDDGSNMNTISAYLSNKWDISPALVFSQGIRFSYIGLTSTYSDTMMKIMKFPFENKIEQNNMAPAGSLGLVYRPGSGWKLSLMGSTGFRAPNVDDLTKVNDSKGKSGILIVPNPELKPEYAYNADVTISKTFEQWVVIEATAFYTWLDNAIVTRPYQYNGQDSIMYDGYMCQVQANTNANGAYVYGAQFHLLAQMNELFSFRSDLTYTFGEVSSENVPMDHIPPIFGKTSFRLEMKKFLAEFYAMYNGWKKAEDYSPGGEDNIEYATQYGMPSWYTLNLKTSYQINRILRMEFGVENMLDVHYRTFASGVSAPGRNFVFAIRAKF